jgi:AAA+ superfamily predicted ATPase
MAINFKSSLDTLNSELSWLSEMITYRFSVHFQQKVQHQCPLPPDLSGNESHYASVIRSLDLDDKQRLLIIIALAPHLRPTVYDIFFTKNSQFDRAYAEFGGLKGEKHSGFIPNGETAAFIIAGSDLEIRFELQEYFDEAQPLIANNILSIGYTKEHEPIWSGELIISKEFLTQVTLNKAYHPRYSSSFPAQKLSTPLEWEDTVFEASVLQEIKTIQSWIKHEEAIMNNHNLGKFLKSGYRVLFYGPPGTGKSMTAAIIGKTHKMDVYRIDLSSLISKYIGETEKNLSKLFNMAKNKGWILFFDEADALFGKRVSSQSSNDMFANQQVSYLLQRIEDYEGIVILATNLKDNIDDAFLRRFQSVVYFPKPKPELRIELWRKYFAAFDLTRVDLEIIAQEYDISGGHIINVLRHCSIIAAERGSQELEQDDIVRGIRKEYNKEGITL